MNRISLKLLTVCGITCFMACTTTQKPKTEKWSAIDRNAQRLLLLVNQILDERKIDKNQMHTFYMTQYFHRC